MPQFFPIFDYIAGMCSSKNAIHKLPVRIRLSFCLWTYCKPLCLQLLSFPTVFANFQADHLQQPVMILRYAIIYGDIKIYSSNVNTLDFLEKLHSASVMLFTLQFRNQATDHFHFFTAAQLNIDNQISGLISIFIKCGKCRVFLSGSQLLRPRLFTYITIQEKQEGAVLLR